MDKSVKYLGLELKNPIIASSSGFTSNIESIKKLEESGVAAVILKSLFEEQINGETAKLSENNEQYEMADYISAYIKENSTEAYLNLISSAKKECNIPIIASICCAKDGNWVNFAKKMEESGADALELNIFYMPTDATTTSSDIEKEYLKTVEHVVKSINIPVSVKISNHFTNPLNLIQELYFRGVKGVVMFNKFYEPDIDVESMSLISSNVFSSSSDIKQPLRWIGIASSINSNISYSGSTGVWNGEDVIKMLVVGANSVQICSVLYKNGMGVIAEMLDELDKWGEDNCFDNIGDAIGMLNYKNSGSGDIFERAQFMKYFSSYGK